LSKPNLDDYVDVAARMAEFFSKYPDGSFQSECQFSQVDDRWVAIVKASAYRHPDDPRPGQGLAYEFIPGLTPSGAKNPYVYNSELQNAETAAWGRAVVAVGAADSKRGIASREEVRNRTENVIDNLAGRQALRDLCEENALDPNRIAALFYEQFGTPAKTAPNDELLSFVKLYKPPEPEPA
jgi:hypothetical protein